MVSLIDPPTDPQVRWLRVAGQLNRLLTAQPDIAVEPENWQTARQINFLYRRRALIVLDDDYPAVAGRLPAHSFTQRQGFKSVLLDVETSIPALVRDINAASGTERRVVAPDHVLHVAAVSICPAVEPLQLPLVLPHQSGGVPLPAAATAQGAKRAVAVLVIDTGLSRTIRDAPAWMSAVTGDVENSWSDGRDGDGEPAGYINLYAGHGTFTAGVLAAAAPDVAIHVEGGLDPLVGATAFESTVVDDLITTLSAPVPPNVVLVNAGFTTDDPPELIGVDSPPGEARPPGADRADLSGSGSERRLVLHDVDEPLTMQLLGRIVEGLSDTVVVCPAGNYGSSRKFWPAAASWAVGVGGLDEAQQRLCGWSNFGDWVDVYARGVHTNAFIDGRYLTLEPQTPAGKTRVFDGVAVWAGTSFAAPVVAAAIAQTAAVQNSTTVEAWRVIAAAAAAGSRTHADWPTVATGTQECNYLP